MNDQQLPCVLSRTDVITRIGILAEFHIRALMTSMDIEEFTEVAEFPVELIPTTVNGYQRFLAETSPTIIQKTAGFILRFKSAMLYELTDSVLSVIEREHVTLNRENLTRLEGGDANNLTLWGVANPTLTGFGPGHRFDVIATTLFLHHIKWLVIRLEAESSREPSAE